MNESSDTYNILAPAKKLSQLIAKSWLDGERLTINGEYLIKHDILTEEEAKFFTTIKAETEDCKRGEVDVVGQSVTIAYSQPSSDIIEKHKADLKAWIKSPSSSEPWFPENQELKELLIIVHNYYMSY